MKSERHARACQLTMNTLQHELHLYAYHLLISSVQACISVITDTLPKLSMPTQPSSESQAEQLPPAGPQPNPPNLKKNLRWSEEETTTLVNFLYEHRSEGSAGHFKAKTFKALATHLSTKFPDRPRSVNAVSGKYTSVRFRISILHNQLIISPA